MSTPLTISSCCIETIDHKGSAIGSQKTIAGLKTYQTGAEFGNDKILVILTDIFGLNYLNNQLVADKMSKQGKIQVLVPDILKGDPVTSIEDFMARSQEWRAAHSVEITEAIVKGFLTELRQEFSPKFVGGIGHCFGAKYVILELAEGGLLDVGAVAHPSNTQTPDYEAITKPIIFSLAEVDQAFSLQQMVDATAALNKNGIHYQLTVFQGTSHGYAVRGDPEDKKIQYAQGKTIRDQVEFFCLYHQ